MTNPETSSVPVGYRYRDNPDEPWSAEFWEYISPSKWAELRAKHRIFDPLYDATTIEQLTADLAALKIESSKFAHGMDKAREERDAAERRSEAFWKPQVDRLSALNARQGEALKHAIDRLDLFLSTFGDMGERYSTQADIEDWRAALATENSNG